ncbi:transcriptional regulator CynR [Pluralibacter gergoviae]|uniref:transcriptional regulator CynR n=1 Tax=Pluralibacter gergoviae TaxID=61647 RepID=UPI0005EC9543|nr:transcriptional regulator CynR [Pluralibacter gergoviae]KJM59631.1 transcriptional regulator [Pluralibacter gergoviae]OUR04054.1 transcriptional regulator CynR [Pluralibacter gergoviae]
MLLRHITYFLAVAEHRGFTRAAQALHVSQPALSQQIGQLEAALGAQLFDRSGRQIRLTDAGEIYMGYAREALRALKAGSRAIHDVEDLTCGTLRLGVTPTFTAYLTGPLLAAFHLRYPGVTLQLREMSQESIEMLLERDELDIGIAFAQVNTAEIEARPLLTETLALVVANHHPLAGRESVDLQHLKEEKFVLLSGEFATREQIDRFSHQAGLHLAVAMEVNAISAVLEMVRRTGLATLLPAAIAAQREGIAAITLSPPLLERTAVLLRRKGSWQTAAARAFTALAHESAAGDAIVPK